MTPTDLKSLVNLFVGLIRTALPLVVALALLAFFWGLVKFIFHLSGDDKALQDGKNLMKWGLVALFVLVSIWGILRFVYGDIGFSRPFGFPQLPQ